MLKVPRKTTNRSTLWKPVRDRSHHQRNRLRQQTITIFLFLSLLVGLLPQPTVRVQAASRYAPQKAFSHQVDIDSPTTIQGIYIYGSDTGAAEEFGKLLTESSVALETVQTNDRDDTPVEDPPAEDPPAEDPPAEDPPAEDPPAEDPPAEEPSTEDPPAEDPPAEDPPAEDPPAEETPAEETPTEGTLGDDESGADSPGSSSIFLPFISGNGTFASASSSTSPTTGSASDSMVKSTSLNAVDLSQYDLIVLADDLYADGAWTVDAQLTQEIIDSGRPIIGMGKGGAYFFDLVKSPFGLGSATEMSGTDVQAMDSGSTFYAQIKAAGGSLALYDADQTALTIPATAQQPDVSRLAALVGTEDGLVIGTHSNQMAFWGFSGSPGSMTDAGRALFGALVAMMTETVEVPLRGRTFIPDAGVEEELLKEIQESETGEIHTLVQLNELPTDETRKQLAEAGLMLVDFFGNTLYWANFSQDFNPDAPAVVEAVRWAGLLTPNDYIEPNVLAGKFEEWADNGDGTVNLLVTFFDTISDEQIRAILDESGAKVSPYGTDTWAVVLSKDAVEALAAQDGVRWIQQGPLPMQIENDTTRTLLNVDPVQAANTAVNPVFYAGLSGDGVNVAVFDTGINEDGFFHNDFAGRLLRTDPDWHSHGTHVAGIIGASGLNSTSNCPFASCTDFQMRGMAPRVGIAPYQGRTNARLDEAINTLGVEVSNHSYKMTCGEYDADAQEIDKVIRGDGFNGGTSIPAHLMVKSAGNSGTSGQYCPQEGYYSLTGAAKNLLIVGALNDNNNYDLRSGSSRGPTFDGRLKPDVTTIGVAHSTDWDSQGYISKGGTSMAAPAATGIVALLIEQYHSLFPAAGTPSPALLRTVVVHTATDLVHEPGQTGFSDYGWNDPDSSEPVIFHAGPDWATGYGVANAEAAVGAMRAQNFVLDTVSPGTTTVDYSITIPAGRDELKFTLGWDDEPGDPAKDVDEPQLVNDLDLMLIAPGGAIHRPWLLPALPSSSDLSSGDADPIDRDTDVLPAGTGIDRLNNLEQVVVQNPAAGTWTVRVNAHALPNGNAQPFSLVGDARSLNIVDPQTGDVAEAGDPNDPNVILVTLEAEQPLGASSASSLADATAADFEVEIEGTPATIVNGLAVGDQFWLNVKAQSGVYSAGSKYDLAVNWIGHGADSETKAILFTEKEQTDRAIVLDHSGSMDDFDKMRSAQNAARLFIDQSLIGDRISVVGFSTNVSTPMGSTDVSADPGNPELEAAKIAVDSFSPTNRTAIGKGLLAGQDQVTANDSEVDVIVLLSDGAENEDPRYDTPAVKGVIEPTDTIIHTVSVGPPSAGHHGLMEEIAEDNGGDDYVVNEESAGSPLSAVSAASASAVNASGRGITSWPQTLPNRLGDTYKQIAEEVLGEKRLFQAHGNPAPNKKLDQWRFQVPDGLKRITFAVNWSQENHILRMVIVGPDGNQYQYNKENPLCRTDITHETCIIESPIAGLWNVIVEYVETNQENEYVVWASARTTHDFQLRIATPPNQRLIGSPINVLGFLSQVGKPMPGQTVLANVFDPNGFLAHELTMVDDGQHGDGQANDGIYGATFVPQSGIGGYAIRGVATGTDLLEKPFWLLDNANFRLRPEILYVHKGDLETAEAYKQLVQQNGVPVKLMHVDALQGNTNLRKYSLVVVGPETGNLDSWGTDLALKNIIGFERPVLGLGEGGYAFFGRLQLNIGWPQGAHGSESVITIASYGDSIWNYPYDININDRKQVELYQEPSANVGIFLEDSAANNLQVFGYDGDDGRYADIIMESGFWMLWGFQDGPKQMTQDGRDLFVNTVFRIMN